MHSQSWITIVVINFAGLYKKNYLHPVQVYQQPCRNLLGSIFNASLKYFYSRKFLEDKEMLTVVLQEIGTLYWNFLQNGIQYLDELILQIQEQNQMHLEDYLNDPIQMNICSKRVLCSFISEISFSFNEERSHNSFCKR